MLTGIVVLLRAGSACNPPAPSIRLPNQDAEYVSHIALDIGGSLIKLIYFSSSSDSHDSLQSQPARGGEQLNMSLTGAHACTQFHALPHKAQHAAARWTRHVSHACTSRLMCMMGIM